MEREIALLIQNIESYDPMILIHTEVGRKILLDDHRILHSWFNMLMRGVKLESPQFSQYSIEEQKKIVRDLHQKVVEAMKTIGYEHKTPIVLSVTAKDLGLINDTFVKLLSDEELKNLHKDLHEFFRKEGEIKEPLYNAHIFVWEEMKRRGLEHKIEDDLDKKSILPTIEYPTPEVGSNATPLHQNSCIGYITIDKVLDSFPDYIDSSQGLILPKIFLAGRIINRGMIPSDHDIDIIIRGYPDTKIVELVKTSCTDENIRSHLHFTFDTEGPMIGYSILLYSPILERGKVEKIGPWKIDQLAKIDVMHPHPNQKPRSGVGTFEFFNTKECWDKWAIDHIDNGLHIQKKFDGMYIQIHKKGQEVKLFTEDNNRDRSKFLPHCTMAVQKIPHDVILHVELVEYDPEGNAIDREDMIKWIVGETVLSDENVILHVHDITYLDGQSFIDKGYEERYDTYQKTVPHDLSNIKCVDSTVATNKEEFLKGVYSKRTEKGSEGAMIKDATGVYSLSGRTSDVCKVKNLKKVNVVIWKIEEKKTTEGIPMKQNVYDCAVPLTESVVKDFRPDSIVEVNGKKMTNIGTSYSTAEKDSIGDTITVRPVKIKITIEKNLKSLSWMFPRFIGKTEESPDSLNKIEEIAKIGTGWNRTLDELSQDIEEELSPCPFYKNPDLCILCKRFIGPIQLRKESLLYPVLCSYAYSFHCKYLKPYYYSIQENNEETYHYKKEESQ